ncbi:hypothetical protein AB0J52_37080, partial [Spirillospora sp. NPDC049652]
MTELKGPVEPAAYGVLRSSPARAHLAALGACLRGQRLRAEKAETGILVSDPARPDVGMLVACRERPSDGDRMWFWGPGGVPLAEADHVTRAPKPPPVAHAGALPAR